MDTSNCAVLPWMSDGDEVCGADGEVVAVVSLSQHQALIVRAVNSHEALVAALRDLLDGTEPWDERATQARAALALAEQGGG